ncbi:alginate lyase family protein [Vibrio kasasachensis]|uniref:alginate lyase family protein n=1 Tax=Vibrio kasasachensis TaxID=2910248 RepID=UPI003D0FD815
MMRLIVHFTVIFALSAILTPAVSLANVVLDPQQYTVNKVVNSSQGSNCTLHPPFTKDLVFISKYSKSEKSKSTVVEKQAQEYIDSTKAINGFASYLAKLSDKLVKSPAPDDLTCYLSNMTNWAMNSSLSTGEVNYVGKAVKKWSLASIASSYLKVSLNYSNSIPDTTDKQIKDWISTLAYQVKHDYSDRKPTQINNHDYWAAWAVIASAAVLHDSELYQWAEDVFVYASGQIDSEGFLPNELKRETRAAMYHNYAMQPLAMLGLFVFENNPDLYEQHRPKIELLTENLFRHALGEAIFEQKTGLVQADSDITIKGRTAWLTPYLTYSPSQEAQIKKVMSITSNFRSTRLGGDLEFLFFDSNN